MEQILETVRAFDGVLELAPTEGSAFPELVWGDHFYYYAPDGQMPQREQPYATIVTKDYPGDSLSDLDPPERWRLNIHIGRARFAELIKEDPQTEALPLDYSIADTILPHPVYRAQGWIAIVNPGDQTSDIAIALLRQAHEDARRRATRRRMASPADGGENESNR